MLKAIIFFVYLVIFAACSPNYDEQAAMFFEQQASTHQDLDISFGVVHSSQAGPVQIKGQLNANAETGQFVMDLFLVNILDTDVLIHANDMTLQTPEGNFSNPLHIGDTLLLPKNSPAHAELVFHPINDRRIFMKTGWNGDLNKEYTLKVNHPIATISLRFEMTENEWNSYQEQHGKEKELVLYELQLDTETQQAYQRALKKPNFVYVNENEIAIAGINLQLNAYQLQDTLYLNAKMVNHSNDVFKVVPGDLQLIINDSATLAVKGAEPHTIRKSQRFIEKYRLFFDGRIDKITIPREFIKRTESSGHTNLLAQDLRFQPGSF